MFSLLRFILVPTMILVAVNIVSLFYSSKPAIPWCGAFLFVLTSLCCWMLAEFGW